AASREEEALEQLAKIAGDLEARGGPRQPAAAGDEAGGPATAAPPVRPAAPAPGRGDLLFLDTGFEPSALPAPPAPTPLRVEAAPVEGLLDVAEDLDLQLGATDVSFDSDADLDLEVLDAESDAAASMAGLPLIDAGPVASPVSPEEVTALEDRIVDDPMNPELHRELADSLLLIGDLATASEALRLTLQVYEGVEDWSGAAAIADRLVALEPDAIHNHQKRVELAFRTGERAPLLEAYLALGDALGRAGATDKALAVYRRVQEHDPANELAAAAIGALTRPPPAPVTTEAPVARPRP